jgi:hypothetical protein
MPTRFSTHGNVSKRGRSSFLFDGIDSVLDTPGLGNALDRQTPLAPISQIPILPDHFAGGRPRLGQKPRQVAVAARYFLGSDMGTAATCS